MGERGMRLALVGALAGLVVIAVLVVLAVAERLRPEAWRSELQTFVEAEERTTGHLIEIVSAEWARFPAVFEPAYSLARHGVDEFGGRVLPYPPTRLVCACLARHPAGRPGWRQIVFVALHGDLYHTDWVVHAWEAEPLSADARHVLEELGCAAVTSP